MGEGRVLLKDLFNQRTVEILAAAIHQAWPEFDQEAFVSAVFDEEWEERELKQRMRHTATTLRRALPGDYDQAITILRKASPATEPAGFAAMVFSDLVEAFGIDDFETSVAALGEFTKVASAEFAVRPFLSRYPDEMLDRMLAWAGDDDWRVRRLASEGSRPRLPWGMALKAFQQDPTPLVPILERLRHDQSDAVRRSVANSLNDISKDHAGVVIDLVVKWNDGTPETAEIARHGLRTLLKQGDPRAMKALGYRANAKLEVRSLTVRPDPAPVGAQALVSFEIVNDDSAPQPVMVDGRITYARPSGTSDKVFKWRQLELGPAEVVAIERKVSLRQLSTRTVYPGTHTVAVQVNGRVRAAADFEVIES